MTAGIAAPAYAGIPVTQRGLASAVALVTGHEDPAKPESDLDWEALAAFPGTLVLYMGVARLEQIAAALIAAGRPASEPAAVVQAGTLPGQRTVRAPLGELAQAVAQAGRASAGDHGRGAGQRAGGADLLAHLRSAGRAHGGGDARAGAGERHGPAAAGARARA